MGGVKGGEAVGEVQHPHPLAYIARIATVYCDVFCATATLICALLSLFTILVIPEVWFQNTVHPLLS